MKSLLTPDESNRKVDAIIYLAIAEDHRLMRELLIENINSSANFKVVLACANGKELLKGLEKLDILPDICILDINMPVLNGYDTQVAIKKRWPEMKSLALSIYDDEHCVVQMILNGANGFISKDSPKELMHEALICIYVDGSFFPKRIGKQLNDKSNGLPFLTKRELEYLNLVCNGLDMDEIAAKLGISVRTVEHYRDSVYLKFQVNNKADLILCVRKTGIIYME